MLDRRTLFKLGTAGVITAALELKAQAVGSSIFSSSDPIGRVIFDERHEIARSFAAVLADQGVETNGIRGDVAQLWYRDLKPSLTERRRPVVGLTDRHSLFCLEELARDINMQISGRVDHRIAPNGSATHEVTGSWAALPASLERVEQFGRQMANLILDPGLRGKSLSAPKLKGPFGSLDETSLVSWVLV